MRTISRSSRWWQAKAEPSSCALLGPLWHFLKALSCLINLWCDAPIAFSPFSSTLQFSDPNEREDKSSKLKLWECNFSEAVWKDSLPLSSVFPYFGQALPFYFSAHSNLSISQQGHRNLWKVVPLFILILKTEVKAKCGLLKKKYQLITCFQRIL